LLTTGTLEEKILQRQYRKGELATTIVDDQRHNVR
jgi:SNF2 family DNA or RNA helicase